MEKTTMAEDDIYGNKERYERELAHLTELCQKPKKQRKYYCKNPENLVYFKKLITYFELKDLSYIRRCRVLQVLKIITFVTDKKLENCTRADINDMVCFSHSTHKMASSKKDFIKDLKCIWRILFPEQDHQGRADETLTPYIVRHLSRKVDKSKEKLRNDRLQWSEFQKLVTYFARDAQMQAYLTLAVESLGRPQEMLFTKIRDYEFQDNFAKVYVSEHGKEGTGFLQCIDSYPFVVEWFKQHPFKDDPNAFFFINLGNRERFQQLKPGNINKKIQIACKDIGLGKNVTCYSLKRNGVTFRRQRGDSDVQIQHAARWTSTKQLQIYDMTTQEDALQIELSKRGLSKDFDKKPITSATKQCTFCSYSNGFTADFCTNCKRPLDRKKIEEMAQVHKHILDNEVLQRFERMERMFERVLERG